MSTPPHILVVDDDDGVLTALRMLFKSRGYQTTCAGDPDEAIALMKRKAFSLVLMDLNYTRDTTSGEEGLALLKKIREADEVLPVIMMTGWGTIDIAVQSMKDGANDFISKPWENDRLLSIIASQLTLAEERRKSQKLSLQAEILQGEINSSANIVAESPVMRNTLATIRRVALTDASVLFTGENGTGKSMFARYLHEQSPRRNNGLISVNMGAINEGLFESEMFGHVKGAFTDAKESRIGRFEAADGGTLFLDEIANTPLSQQNKLLRVIEDKEFEKVGAKQTLDVDFRLICATNADLKSAVENGDFRKDLLFRINTLQIEIPPLRTRKEDIVPLANSFLSGIARKYGSETPIISPGAKNALNHYEWPGNVRELHHVVERAYILKNGDMIELPDLALSFSSTPNSISEHISQLTEPSCNDLRTLEEIEANALEKRLAQFNGDANQAAKSLGLSRSAYYRRLSKVKGLVKADYS